MILENTKQSIELAKKMEEEQAERLKNATVIELLTRDYRITFNTDEGKRILNDLERRCHDFSTSYVKGDSHQSAFLEGQRSVLIYIKNKLRKLGV
tara:strand:+ start:280 stop:564 length:285 start_codon:yes stop_codon:yes gene_type:complete